MSEDRPVNRRGFFREAIRELLRNAEKAAEPFADALKQFEVQTDTQESTPKLPRYAGPGRLPADVWLRPPGALPESKFRETCSRCGRCAEVCPAQCIKIDPTGLK